MLYKSAAPPYSGMIGGLGITPNPIIQAQQLLNPQPVMQPNQVVPGANPAQPNQALPAGGNVGAPTSAVAASMNKQTRGFNNTPTNNSSKNPGSPGRPPSGVKKGCSTNSGSMKYTKPKKKNLPVGGNSGKTKTGAISNGVSGKSSLGFREGVLSVSGNGNLGFREWQSRFQGRGALGFREGGSEESDFTNFLTKTSIFPMFFTSTTKGAENTKIKNIGNNRIFSSVNTKQAFEGIKVNNMHVSEGFYNPNTFQLETHSKLGSYLGKLAAQNPATITPLNPQQTEELNNSQLQPGVGLVPPNISGGTGLQQNQENRSPIPPNQGMAGVYNPQSQGINTETSQQEPELSTQSVNPMDFMNSGGDYGDISDIQGSGEGGGGFDQSAQLPPPLQPQPFQPPPGQGVIGARGPNTQQPMQPRPQMSNRPAFTSQYFPAGKSNQTKRADDNIPSLSQPGSLNSGRMPSNGPSSLTSASGGLNRPQTPFSPQSAQAGLPGALKGMPIKNVGNSIKTADPFNQLPAPSPGQASFIPGGASLGPNARNSPPGDDNQPKPQPNQLQNPWQDPFEGFQQPRPQPQQVPQVNLDDHNQPDEPMNGHRMQPMWPNAEPNPNQRMQGNNPVLPPAVPNPQPNQGFMAHLGQMAGQMGQNIPQPHPLGALGAADQHLPNIGAQMGNLAGQGMRGMGAGIGRLMGR